MEDKCNNDLPELQYIVPNGFMFKFDMKSGYHHEDIAYPDQQFLEFAWPLDLSIDRFFCFNVLPFGLPSAPYLFTKLFLPLTRKTLEIQRFFFRFTLGRQN